MTTVGGNLAVPATYARVKQGAVPRETAGQLRGDEGNRTPNPRLAKNAEPYRPLLTGVVLCLFTLVTYRSTAAGINDSQLFCSSSAPSAVSLGWGPGAAEAGQPEHYGLDSELQGPGQGGTGEIREFSLVGPWGCLPAMACGNRRQGGNRPLSQDRKSTRLNSSHTQKSRMPSSA